MSFIEKTLPVEYLNPIALSEGNSKSPLYQMHKWWARRLGSVFRAITVAIFSHEDESEASVWRKFCDGADLAGKIVLDPFMGGGTTIAEALRLGCRTIGVDINPVAWFVTKKEVEPVDLDELDAAFRQIEATAGQRIRALYTTHCPSGHQADVMYFFWVKVAECRACGTRVKLIPNYELSSRDHINVCFCPRCLHVIETAGYHPQTTCPECGYVFDPRRGVSGRGMFRCANCGEEQELLDAVKRKGTALDLEMHALEGYCAGCGRFFKRVDENDLAEWQKAKVEFERCRDTLLFPRQAIPTEGRSDPRPINHGYTHFWQMFNERQLLSLSILLEAIMHLPDQNIRELMLTAFSDCLDSNNMFCKYEIEWHKISVFFGLHAYHPIERPAENNVWGTEFGRGTFVKCFEKVRRAKAYAQNPHVRLTNLRGDRFNKRTGEEKIEGNLVETFEALVSTDHAALLLCQSSEELVAIPDRSVDAVITDPPYFDNVQYSELADFFYVWLRLGLKDTYPWFEPELSGRPREIVKNEKLDKTTDFFNQGLRRVFTECHRVLKDDGLLVFTFHHNKTWAWEGIGELLLDAGFYVSASPVVRSEGKSGFHSSEGNIKYDCVLVCRKRQRHALRPAVVSEEAILKDAVTWTQRTMASGMAVNEVDVFAIVMGQTLKHYTASYSNEEAQASLLSLLTKMEALVPSMGDVQHVVQHPPDSPYGSQVRQLALLIMESRAPYKDVASA